MKAMTRSSEKRRVESEIKEKINNRFDSLKFQCHFSLCSPRYCSLQFAMCLFELLIRFWFCAVSNVDSDREIREMYHNTLGSSAIFLEIYSRLNIAHDRRVYIDITS